MWYHDSVPCISVFIGLSNVVVQAGDGYGDCLRLSAHVSLGLNGVELGDLVDVEVSRALLEVVSYESWDSRGFNVYNQSNPR